MADLLSTIGQGVGAFSPLISGGLSLVGGLMQQGGMQSSIQQQEAFQDKESSTAYQRAVPDMEKAGLNPALMYGSGGPESSPSGASMMPPNITGGVASSALDAATTMKQLEQYQSSIDLNKANTSLAGATATKVANEIPLSDFEGQAAKTVQSLLAGIEKWAQGWGRANSTPGNINNLIQGVEANAASHNGPSLWDDFESGLNPFDALFMSPTWKGH